MFQGASCANLEHIKFDSKFLEQSGREFEIPLPKPLSWKRGDYGLIYSTLHPFSFRRRVCPDLSGDRGMREVDKVKGHRDEVLYNRVLMTDINKTSFFNKC